MPSPPRGFTAFPSQADLFYLCTTSSTSEEDLNIHYLPPSKSSLRIGVVICGQDQVQLLDLAVLDLLTMMGRNRVNKMKVSAGVIEEAVDEIDVRFVNASGEGSFSTTSGARIPVTNSFANAPLFDILMIPGSFSSSELSVPATSFLTAQYSNPYLIAIMSVASGILHLVQTGLLHNTRATAPHCLLPALRQRYPGTAWQKSPWARQEKIWSSSSAISALDMMTAWMREYFWDRCEAVEFALNASGIDALSECNC
ncbi:hypothetical protein P153DRAFT_64707 [Dothidotthia symphoricarpi CBS 119687]|uniref:DJ-1/PfpI domain-containing protein n=1 Tax=Dothidotthia symphoricarpi CBS 119687 TaxID=1392245 RepID=A0A6A6A942_9PLEO|nr:uncharacterized protein P153DRAFT_64707 [Dothidotthia symphoricarpi CBS 119687]KAF2127357.1 hypothetical protein P153DRAFT_64707 [Dothidotthia symphoricarpi CBS 119687]